MTSSESTDFLCPLCVGGTRYIPERETLCCTDSSCAWSRYLREFLREWWEMFRSEGMGWRRPAAAYREYRANAEAFVDDLTEIQVLRCQQAEEALVQRAQEARERRSTHEDGVSDETRAMISEVQHRGWRLGQTPEQIEQAMQVSVRGVRNVLRAGSQAVLRDCHVYETNDLVEQYVRRMRVMD